MYFDGANTFRLNPGGIRISNALAYGTPANSVLGGVENLQNPANVDDFRRAGETLANIFLKNWYPADITISGGGNNNIEVAAAARPDNGVPLIGSAAICSVDKSELFYNTFRGVGGGNSRASKADRKTTDG